MSTGRPPASEALDALAELLSADPRAPTSIRARDRVEDEHIADSLSGLEVDSLRKAGRIADLGSGAGLPGLVLAASLPAARVDLIEANGKKCAFIERAAAAMGLANARVLNARAEELAQWDEREAYDAVTARAVGNLRELAELASPLLRKSGVLVAWKGARARDEERELAEVADRLAMVPREIVAVTPFAGARDRHLHVVEKSAPTPGYLPRRPGMARKRPPPDSSS